MQKIAHKPLKSCRCAAPRCTLPLHKPRQFAKKPEPESPGCPVGVCPDKIKNHESQNRLLAQSRMHPVQRKLVAVYALRLGRTVRSRTCARMLDICIPFSCDR
jgi:hypothetical protein